MKSPTLKTLALLLALLPVADAVAQQQEPQPQPDEPAAPAAPPAKPLEQVTERGPVKATVRVTPTDPVIGDPVTLTVEVVAEEGVELLMPEFGQSLDRFAILDFLPRERVDDAGRTLASQTYTLQPPMSGPQSVPPIMIEFVDRRPDQRPAPDGEDAYEMLTERLDFEVASVTPAGAAGDLDPPLEPLAKLVAPRPPLWPWLLGALALLAAVAPFAWRAFAVWRGRARRRSAYEIAHARLQALTARPLPAPEQIDAFFVELSDIVRHYLEDRFVLHAPELTTDEFLDVVAGSPDLTAGHKGFLRDFLRRADMVKFARHVPDAQAVAGALSPAAQFLEQTKEDAPLVDEAAAPHAAEEAARA